ncbi:MAG: glycosyltransferase family 39 protein [Actinobacteria bacterium]|nr:glycosyltransferase family 39 protein [Actinomycetota bacterium]MCB9413019.1 glycosyltransferase family 39 protein [Actinomycetota bacterium]
MTVETADASRIDAPVAGLSGASPTVDSCESQVRTSDRPGWRNPGIWLLLLGAAALYLWGLDRNGFANSFYSAAVQAGSSDWTAWFYGSSDAANSITVDKPPLSLMVMGLSARVFGLNYWSVLVPQALMGVASVGLLYAGIRRWYGTWAGLFAGAMLAVTPVAALMFRFNNPDALLVLLLVAAAYAMVRAVEKASPIWIAVAGTLVGLGFMAKMLQAFLVLPAFALTYLVAAPANWTKRLRHLLLAVLAVTLAGGWWVVVVELTPASMRPYIGGSQSNSALELVLGYNGLGRITGNEVGSVGGPNAASGGPGAGPGGAGGFGGDTGVGRLLEAAWIGGIGWFLPAALIMALAAVWLRRFAARTDRLRAGVVLWGLWAVVTWAVFSFASGIIHEYYAIALAPALAALVAIGTSLGWANRQRPAARLLLAGGLFTAAVTASVIMARAGGWYAAVGLGIGIVGGVSAVVLGSPYALNRTVGRAALATATATLLIGPSVFSVHTALTPQTGSLPSVSPALASASPGGPGGGAPPAGANGAPTGGMGGLLDAPQVDAEVATLLNTDAANFTWVAAGIGSQSTAGFQLATGNPVMPIGGFNGTDPAPTLTQFQQYVAEGEIHYFIGGTGGFGPAAGGSDSAAAIEAWVAQNFASVTVDGVVLYDLTAPVGDSGGVPVANS